MHKSELIKTLCLILNNNRIESNLKEISSHIISAILGFCELENSKEEYFSFVLKWTTDHHILTYFFLTKN